HAIDVANVIREVYRESMNNNPLNQRTFTSPFVTSTRMSPTLNIDANGNPRGVSLSVGIDDRTNSLVLSCPEKLFQDIRKLVDQLEKASADTTQTVKVVSIKGIDPHLVQQALDAIQGRRTPSPGISSQSSGNS